jgi:membrane-bound lytic murein transglycosylase B
MFQNRFYLIYILAVIFFAINASAIESCDDLNFEEWKECLINKLSAKSDNIDISALRKANYIERVIELDKKQPEKTLSFAEYKKIVLLHEKAISAAAYYRENAELIKAVTNQYAIEPEIIVAIVALESNLGERQGNFNIIDALATLSYDGRRKAFFEKELINALTILHNENISYEDLSGSWAGAMGQCQFMPSSYIAYATDYDKDGVKDIWKNKGDVFASIAKYLISNGWKKGESTIGFIKEKEVLKEEQCQKNSNVCDYHNNKLSLINFDNYDSKQEKYLVGSNFNVLMKWNRSTYFGISILLVADEIRKKSQKEF